MYDRIQKLRESNHKAVGEVAEVIGCSISSYLNREKGIRKLKTPELVKLAKRYHVSMDYIVNLTDISEPY